MGCMSARSRGQSKTSSGTSSQSGNSSYHAWDVILKYYQMKGGPEYNAAPARYASWVLPGPSWVLPSCVLPGPYMVSHKMSIITNFGHKCCKRKLEKEIRYFS